MFRPKVWEAQRFNDGDWARVTSPHGSITVPVALHAGLNAKNHLDLERRRQTQRHLGT